MKLAYVDTSCLVAIAFDEPGAGEVARRLARFDRLLSSNLLEAELRSDRITSLGYLNGADLWHLACALFLAPQTGDLAFLTLDRRRGEVAVRLGFPAPV